MAKNKKSNAGRPTKMDKLTLQKLQEAFLMDCTDEEACFYADIAPATLYNYQKENPEFIEKKQAWKVNPVFKARKKVIDSLDSDSELALKYLERKKKDEFAPKSEFGGVLDIPAITKLSEDIRGILDEKKEK